MRPVVTVAEMAAADRRAAEADPGAEARLVRRAGTAVAYAAIGLLGGTYGRRIVVVAGPGNNGADGRVAAAHLQGRGARVTVVAAAGRDQPPPVLPPCDLVIDAAFGTGFGGDYTAPDPDGAPVLAVDIPSGVHGDTGQAGPGAVTAAATVTFAALKPGLLLGEGPERAGHTTVADIGLDPGPAGIHLVEDADVAWLAPRGRDAHKWDRAVWVVAGSPGMRGAASFCARAAQRGGAGMVRIGSPGLDAGDHPPSEAVAKGLPAVGWDEVVLVDLDRFDAVVVGPGLGRDADVAAAVRRLVGASTVPVVVDADGLNALGAEVAGVTAEAKSPVVLTPHDGEFARLAGSPPGADRVAAVRGLAATTGAIVLLKGSTTVVADPSGAVLLSVAGDARLATAGTGDVLTGLIGALIAGGVAPFQAAALAAHLPGRVAAPGPPVGLVAGDIIELLPMVLEDLH